MTWQHDLGLPDVDTDPVLVIGAGPAGLAAAAALTRRGVPVRVVEQADAVGAAWRAHYDRLHLHTVRWDPSCRGTRFRADTARGSPANT
jgi:cation diffusion facilitator CzcD-associated flavoprotein CzcO